MAISARVVSSFLLVAILLCVSTVQAQTGPVVKNCYVTLIEVSDVPAQETGVLLVLGVTEGMKVKQGDVSGRIDDARGLAQRDLAEAELQKARDESENDVSVRYAKAQSEVDKAELDAGRSLQEKRAITPSELRRLNLQFDTSKLRIEQVQKDLKIATYDVRAKQASWKAADIAVQRCQILATVNGEVQEIRIRPGEWVSPGDVVLRLIQLDRMRVEGFLNINACSPDEVRGRNVVATVDLPRGRTANFRGKVVFVDKLLQAGGEYRVRAEVENVKDPKGEWILQPGLRAQMTVQ